MRWLPLLVALTACSKLLDLADVTYGGPEDGGASDAGTSDAAAVPDGGSTPVPDAMTAALDCPTYCGTVTANCTGIHAQYGGASDADLAAHCMATCVRFPPGTSMDMTGNTLGCRINFANIAKLTDQPMTHCPHAGPAGDQVSFSGVCGSPCENFCSLEIAACGLSGVDPNGQYADMTSCLEACAGFDRTHAYTIDATTIPTGVPSGDSLACRLYHTTNALISGAAAVHCPHTRAVTSNGNPCFGMAMP